MEFEESKLAEIDEGPGLLANENGFQIAASFDDAEEANDTFSRLRQ